MHAHTQATVPSCLPFLFSFFFNIEREHYKYPVGAPLDIIHVMAYLYGFDLFISVTVKPSTKVPSKKPKQSTNVTGGHTCIQKMVSPSNDEHFGTHIQFIQ